MEALQIKLLREAPPFRKMELLASLNQCARQLALAGLRQRYPDASEAALQRRLADLLLGPELARSVLGEQTDAA
jgi:hypothetical protein